MAVTMGRRARTGEFTAYAEQAQQRLFRQAVLLTGDPDAARDLVQSTLVKVYVAWSRIDTPAAYAPADDGPDVPRRSPQGAPRGGAAPADRPGPGRAGPGAGPHRAAGHRGAAAADAGSRGAPLLGGPDRRPDRGRARVQQRQRQVHREPWSRQAARAARGCLRRTHIHIRSGGTRHEHPDRRPARAPRARAGRPRPRPGPGGELRRPAVRASYAAAGRWAAATLAVAAVVGAAAATGLLAGGDDAAPERQDLPVAEDCTARRPRGTRSPTAG